MPVFSAKENLSFSAKRESQVKACDFLFIILCFCLSKLCNIHKSRWLKYNKKRRVSIFCAQFCAYFLPSLYELLFILSADVVLF